MELSTTAGDGAHSPAEARIHILVVEDELFIRMFVSDALRDEGYAVIEAFNGDEAADILKAGKMIDLVFSDVLMPGSLDGIGLLRFIKEHFSELPVILASGHLDPEVGLAAGAKQSLRKPYNIETIKDLVATELTQRA
jgi:CheY-like chemotaxis protein